MMKCKAHPELVNYGRALRALELTRKNGITDKKAAYSRYVQLSFQATGSLAPGCDNKDLQAFYGQIGA